jgi:hypothetical protein
MIKVLAQEATVEYSGAKITLDNDPISYAVTVCVTVIILAYLFLKLKKKD